jgi:hypothetical protein
LTSFGCRLREAIRLATEWVIGGRKLVKAMSSCNSGQISTKVIGKRRWLAGFALRPTLFGAIALMSSALAQSPVTMYAYSRATLPGIPGNQKVTQENDVFPPKYYLYIEVEPRSRVSAEWAWVLGNYYDCTLKKMSTPVLVESDTAVPTEKKETLVRKTLNDVYRVILGHVITQTASNDRERKLIANHQAAIKLVVNNSSTYVAVQSIKALRPAAAM